MQADGLSFDEDLCDDCGLCAAACPQDALSLLAPALHHRPPPAARAAGMSGQPLLLACAPALADMPADATPPVEREGVTPCLHALTPGWLWQVCQQQGVTSVAYLQGDCSHCPRRPYAPQDWRTAWKAFGERLRAQGRAAPALKPLSKDEWRAAAAQQQAVAASERVAPARRGLLQRVLRHPAPQGGEALPAHTPPPLSAHRAAAVQALAAAPERPAAAETRTDAPAPPPPLWLTPFELRRCTWCMACVHVCAPQAIRLRRDDAHQRALFDIHPAACTGCGLCHDVCASGALGRPVAPPASAPAVPARHVPLLRSTCPTCKAPYDHPPTARDRHAPCPTCRQGRPPVRNRIVQTE